jgi:Mn2+/Fe2+ NRAMP family transporter
MFIIIATAAAIGGHGPLTSARQAAEALRPVAGSAAELLFAVGLLGASALAGAVVPLSTSYAISEAVGVERSVSRRFREAPWSLPCHVGLPFHPRTVPNSRLPPAVAAHDHDANVGHRHRGLGPEGL